MRTSISHSKDKAVHCRPVNCQWLHHQPAGWPVWDSRQSFYQLSSILSSGRSNSVTFYEIPSSHIQPSCTSLWRLSFRTRSSISIISSSNSFGDSFCDSCGDSFGDSFGDSSDDSSSDSSGGSSTISLGLCIILCRCSDTASNITFAKSTTASTAYVQIFSKRMVESFMYWLLEAIPWSSILPLWDMSSQIMGLLEVTIPCCILYFIYKL